VNKQSVRRFMILCLAITLLVTFQSSTARSQKLPVIGFIQVSSITPLEATRLGAIAALNQAGFVDGKTAQFMFADAKGDATQLPKLVQDYVDQKVDVILSISTAATQAVLKATQTGKGPTVIFAAVTDPYVSGIAVADCQHAPWLVGSQALAPFEQAVALITKIKPDAKTVGYLYNPAESNSVVSTKFIQPAVEKMGLTMEIQTVASIAEVQKAAESVAAKQVDVFLVGSDTTIEGGITALLKVATDNKIPVISVNPSGDPQAGAVLALGLDYTQVGQNAGRLAALVLNKKFDTATAKIIRETATLLVVNADAAAAMGITVPDELLKTASTVYKDGQATTPAAIASMVASRDDDWIKARTCTVDELNATPAATQSQ
jgi:putative ABC transport system substrate-binding protein